MNNTEKIESLLNRNDIGPKERLILLKNYIESVKNNSSNNKVNNLDNDGTSKASSKVYVKTSGHSLIDRNEQAGIVKIIMLTIISFISEILFLVLSLALYK